MKTSQDQQDIRIRLAGPEDENFIRVCARQAYLPYVERIGRKPAPMVADFAALIARGTVHIAERGPDPCGFIVFHTRNNGFRTTKPAFHTENIAVLPKFHGNGIGKALLSFAEQEARRAGA